MGRDATSRRRKAVLGLDDEVAGLLIALDCVLKLEAVQDVPPSVVSLRIQDLELFDLERHVVADRRVAPEERGDRIVDEGLQRLLFTASNCPEDGISIGCLTHLRPEGGRCQVRIVSRDLRSPRAASTRSDASISLVNAQSPGLE